MNFGIIGGGVIAGFHAQAIAAMAGAELHSVWMRNSAKGIEFAKRYGSRYMASLSEFLADPELDIVTIATPSGAHLEPAMEAARAGKHVICEKPLEVTCGRIDQMMEVCEQAGVVLAGIFNRRFHGAMEALKAAADAGRFGQLSLVEASVKWYRDQAYYDSAAWRGTWRLDGGGALMNQSIHTIDQLLYVVGQVARVSASITCVAHHGIEVEDTAVAILEFENGARGVIQGSTACWSSAGHPARLQLCGDTGSAFLNDETLEVWDFLEPLAEDDSIRQQFGKPAAAGLGANDPKAINFIGHQRNFEDVIEAIQTGRPPLVDGAEARKSVALIEAIYQSAKNSGAWISVSH